MSEPVGVKEHEATVFAKEIATTLEKAVAEGKTNKIYIVASPSFLGMLRKNFHAPLEKAIAGEVDKDICMLSTKEIREHLPYVL
jgi:protein required for attachment to host cells